MYKNFRFICRLTLLSCLLMCMGSNTSNAQINEQATVTSYKFPSTKITGGSTYATYTAVPRDAVSLSATVIKDSGSIGGYIFVECSGNGTLWENCTATGDSVAIQNNSSLQGKMWQISKLTKAGDAYSYRIKIELTGSGARVIPTSVIVRKPNVTLSRH